MIQLLIKAIQLLQAKLEKDLSCSCVDEMHERLTYLSIDFSNLVKFLTKFNIEKEDVAEVLGLLFYYITRIKSELCIIVKTIPYILDKRKKFLLSNEEIEDKERRLREGEQQSIAHLYLESLSLFEKINERLKIELIPQNELQKRRRGIEKMEQDVYEFTAYLNTMERAIPQNKKEAKQFLLCINSFLIKIYQEADAMDNLCNIIAERYRLYYQKTDAIG